MADICEICMKPLEIYIDGIPDYDDFVLCRQCEEKVEEIEFSGKGSGKPREECVKIIRKEIMVCERV